MVAGSPRRFLRGLVHPMVLIFFFAGIFSYLSGDTVRAVYFLVVGLALAADRASARAAEARDRGNRRDDEAERGLGSAAVFSSDSLQRRRAATSKLVAAAAVGGLVYAVVVGSFQRYSVPATIAITALAAFAVVSAWRTSAGSSAAPARLDPLGLAAWAILGVGAATWELAALFLQPTLRTDSPAHPTLSYLADGLLANWPGRSVVIFAWLAFGWYLARL
jgi:hypothetical protein